jgi:hypothetical protein
VLVSHLLLLLMLMLLPVLAELALMLAVYALLLLIYLPRVVLMGAARSTSTPLRLVLQP